jgi:hypothetical protein
LAKSIRIYLHPVAYHAEIFLLIDLDVHIPQTSPKIAIVFKTKCKENTGKARVTRTQQKNLEKTGFFPIIAFLPGFFAGFAPLRKSPKFGFRLIGILPNKLAVFKARVVTVVRIEEVVVEGFDVLVVGLRHAAPGLNSTASLKSVHKLSNSFGPSSTSRALANGAYVAGDCVCESSEYSSSSSS